MCLSKQIIKYLLIKSCNLYYKLVSKILPLDSTAAKCYFLMKAFSYKKAGFLAHVGGQVTFCVRVSGICKRFHLIGNGFDQQWV